MLRLWAVAAIGLGLAGCAGQPYQVFAVQVGTAPPAGAAAAMRPVALRTDTGAAGEDMLHARHPQWDLNHASAEELGRLPGATAAQVAAMIAGRPYASKRELLKRHVVTAAEYARWKDYLVVHRAKR